MSDENLVKESGINDRFVEMGLRGKGVHVLADRGFNMIAPLLLKNNIHLAQRRGTVKERRRLLLEMLQTSAVK